MQRAFKVYKVYKNGVFLLSDNFVCFAIFGCLVRILYAVMSCPIFLVLVITV